MYKMTADMGLQAAFESDSAKVGTLKSGSLIEVLKGPIEEKPDTEVRFKGLVTGTGQIGWLTLTGDNLKPWGPRYRCVYGTAINDVADVASESAQTLRKLEVGEPVELLEGPTLEAGAGIMRLRGKADRDGVVGWISIAGNQGKQFLKVA